MVAPILPLKPLTVEEEFAFEEASPERHEYVRGEVYANTGPSRRHNQIAGQLLRSLTCVREGRTLPAWRRVACHWRDPGGDWQETEITDEGTVPIPCPETTSTLDQIYEGLAPLTLRELEAMGYST
jgi:Uma2 family endonuclease